MKPFVFLFTLLARGVLLSMSFFVNVAKLGKTEKAWENFLVQ
jgi:hypothetical protein